VTLPVLCTDPPYYDNIGYADLSDFFYVWLRRSIGKLYPDIFSTLLVPKTQELVATPYRFDGDKDKAKRFFEEGLGMAFAKAHEAQHSDYPLTVFYAFKQSESAEDGVNGSPVASTGWETMLQGLLKAGFHVDGTWPMRTELSNRPVASGTNALASSIVLVCRKRSEEAPMATRREFVAALRKELPAALRTLTQANIAPVDLAQASIGPGMAVFSRYSKVLEADGSAMPVRAALQIINQELDTYLAEQEGDLDRDTQFCIAWFEQYGMEDAPFGEADVLARAKDTAVEGLVEAGVLAARGGKVRILNRSELPDDWNPTEDTRLTVWECTQHLIRRLEKDGEEGAALLCARLGGGRGEDARALAYRLYSICDRKGRTEQALAYNTLVTSWPAIQEKVAHRAAVGEQAELL
jgi:putative DNA methylase